MSGDVDSSALLALPERFVGLNVWVVGDLMLDEYVTGAVERISPEAPVPVVRAQASEHRLGGAANAHTSIAGTVEHLLSGACTVGPQNSRCWEDEGFCLPLPGCKKFTIEFYLS